MALRIVNQLAKMQGQGGGADSWALKNYLPPGYNSVDKTFEKHLPLGSYTGPGTNIQKRWLQKGLHGTTYIDEGARHHDIQYYNLGLLKAQKKITDQMLNKGIWNADNQLVKKASIFSRNPINAMQSALVIPAVRGKQGLQSMGVFNKAAFTKASNPNAKPISEDEPKYVDELPLGYMQGGKPPKRDRLRRLRKALKKFEE